MKSLVLFVSLLILGSTWTHPEDKSKPMPALEQINDLAAPEHLQTEADAMKYIAALWTHFNLDSFEDQGFKERLGESEFLAVQNPSARVSNARIADVFNELMREISAPASMRVTEDEVFRFRKRLVYFPRASFVFPNLFARTSDGNLDQQARPIEALFVIYLLQYGSNIEAIKQPVEVPNGQMKARSTITTTVVTGPSPREAEYNAAVEQYFRAHSEAAIKQSTDRLLSKLLADQKQ